MRFTSFLLAIISACALAACTSSTNTNQTNANAPAQTTTQATDQPSAPTQPGASPAVNGAPQSAAVVPGAPASGNPTASANAAGQQRDACALITADEIKAVQGEAFKDAKSSQREDGSFAVAQCFYTTPTFTKSVSLELTQAKTGGAESPRKFWDEHFTRAAKEGGERERERSRDKDKDKDKDKNKARGEEEEEEGPPPARVAGIGDAAYWVNSRVSGALYVLKGDRFIRVSIGGADADAARQKKAKMLAQKALARL
ncbi:MAG TPA: hypothetical protein VF525_15945 [Pyrinomonadaceae bacterium]|jgi:hypothetical protein